MSIFNITVTAYPLFDTDTTDCLRIAIEQNGNETEVAYWHTSGNSDITQGQQVTLPEAIAALTAFTFPATKTLTEV